MSLAFQNRRFLHDCARWSIYPFTGYVSNHAGGVATSQLLAVRQIAKLHRLGLARKTATDSSKPNGELCSSSYAWRIPKSQYRTQMTYPKANVSSEYACNNIGMSDVMYSSGREYPTKGEDFVYMLWRKKIAVFFNKIREVGFMKFIMFFCYMYLGLSMSALAKCSDEMKTIEWMQQLAEGAAADSGKQDSAAAGFTHSSQKIRKSVFGQTESGSQFYIFVTLGMKEKNIKELMDAAKRYGGTFVIRGLHKGSMRETVKYFSRFASDVAGGFIIDPTLFRKYSISTAPAFVLTDGESYDVLYGNVMPEFALREFAKKGDLSLHA